MIVSLTTLKTAVEHYKLKKAKKEGYDGRRAAGAGMTAAFASFGLAIAVLFFILEIIVLFYAVMTALVCTTPGPERIISVILAVTFTIPYMLLNLLFNKCTRQTLRNSNGWKVSSA
jgi:hypothetical protein